MPCPTFIANGVIGAHSSAPVVTMRKLFIQLHKYTGLLLGVLLTITGLTGSLLVFDRELDEWLTPATVAFEPPADIASLDLALANATAAVNNGTQPTRIALGRNNATPHIIRFPPPPGAPGSIEVSISPADSSVLAIRGWGEYPVTWIYYLHMAFLGGTSGEIVVGVMGVTLLFLCISGVVIWWPRRGLWWRAFTINSRLGAFRLNYDLHKTTGIYFLPVLFVLAFSGTELIFHEPVEKLVNVFLPVIEPPAPLSAGQGEPVGADRAAAAAQIVFPDARLFRVYLPAGNTDPYRVTFVRPGDNWNEYAPSTVYLDQFSGKVLNVYDHREQPAGNIFLDWMFPLHNGDALGLFGRILVFIAGLLPAVLFGTGFYLWWVSRPES